MRQRRSSNANQRHPPAKESTSAHLPTGASARLTLGGGLWDVGRGFGRRPTAAPHGNGSCTSLLAPTARAGERSASAHFARPCRPRLSTAGLRRRSSDVLANGQQVDVTDGRAESRRFMKSHRHATKNVSTADVMTWFVAPAPCLILHGPLAAPTHQMTGPSGLRGCVNCKRGALALFPASTLHPTRDHAAERQPCSTCCLVAAWV